jgi:hypothetical protein
MVAPLTVEQSDYDYHKLITSAIGAATIASWMPSPFDHVSADLGGTGATLEVLGGGTEETAAVDRGDLRMRGRCAIERSRVVAAASSQP